MEKKKKLENELIRMYPDLRTVIEDEKYTEEDLSRYMRYCATGKLTRISEMKAFDEIKKKAKLNGVESLLWRKDLNVRHSYVDFLGAHGENVTEKAYEVVTKYGSFKMTKSREIFED